MFYRTLVLAIVLSMLAGCAASEGSVPETAEPPVSTPDAVEDPSGEVPMPIEPETLPLITQPAPQTEFEEALLTGTLEYDMNGCWRVSSEGNSFLIIWPEGFTATAMIGAPQVLDTSGEVVGTAGMEISLGGGAREDDAAVSYEEQHPDLPSAECPGPYWVVGQVMPLQ